MWQEEKMRGFENGKLQADYPKKKNTPTIFRNIVMLQCGRGKRLEVLKVQIITT